MCVLSFACKIEQQIFLELKNDLLDTYVFQGPITLFKDNLKGQGLFQKNA